MHHREKGIFRLGVWNKIECDALVTLRLETRLKLRTMERVRVTQEESLEATYSKIKMRKKEEIKRALDC